MCRGAALDMLIDCRNQDYYGRNNIRKKNGCGIMTAIDKVLGAVLQAIEIEKFGYEFYNSMRTFVEDKEGQKLISYLGRLEVDHIKWLEEEYDRQLAKLDEFKEEPTVDISLLGKGKIFFADNKLPDVFKEFDAVKATGFAIDIEKRSVEFYQKNIEISEDDGTKELFLRLADFEKDHIVILENNLQSLQTKGAWKAPSVPMVY